MSGLCAWWWEHATSSRSLRTGRFYLTKTAPSVNPGFTHLSRPDASFCNSDIYSFGHYPPELTLSHSSLHTFLRPRLPQCVPQPFSSTPYPLNKPVFALVKSCFWVHLSFRLLATMMVYFFLPLKSVRGLLHNCSCLFRLVPNRTFVCLNKHKRHSLSVGSVSIAHFLSPYTQMTVCVTD